MADGPRHPSIVQKIGQPNLFIRHFPNTKPWSPAIQNFSGADAYVNRVLLQRPLVLKCQGSASPLVSPPLPISAGAPLEKRKVVLLSNFISGGIYLVSLTVIAPICRVKLMMQSQNEMIKSGRLSMPYKGIVDCFARTIRNEGIISLWRGNTPALIRVLSIQAFTSLLRYNEDNYSFSQGLVDIGFNLALSPLIYPLQYAQTRLANDIKAPGKAGQREFKGLIDVYRKTLNSDGVAGLYRGLNISIVDRIVSLAISGGLLRSLTPMIPLHGLQNSSLTSFTVNLGTTFCAVLATYSTNTVSNRMKMTSGKDAKYKSSLDAFNQIIKNEGVKSLYKGAGACIVAFGAFGACNFGFHKILLCLLKPAKKNESAGESTSGASPDAGRPVYDIKIKWK